MAKPNKGAPPVKKAETSAIPATKDEKDAKRLANHNKMLKNLVSLQNMSKSNPEGAADIISMSKTKITKAELATLLEERKINQTYHDWLISDTEIVSSGRTRTAGAPREKVIRTYPKSFAVYHPTDPISPVKGVTPERTPNPKMLNAGTEFYSAFLQFQEEQEDNLAIFRKHGMYFSDYFRKGDPEVEKPVK